MFVVEHVTTMPYYPRFIRQAEGFVKTVIRKSNKEILDKEVLQQFLRVYCVTTNPNTPICMLPVELMLTRKVKSVFYKFLLNKKTKIAR